MESDYAALKEKYNALKEKYLSLKEELLIAKEQVLELKSHRRVASPVAERRASPRRERKVGGRGGLWDEEEKANLLQEYCDGLKLSNIAKEHERTENAIKLKLKELLSDKYQREREKDRDFTYDDLAQCYNRSRADIEDILAATVRRRSQRA